MSTAAHGHEPDPVTMLSLNRRPGMTLILRRGDETIRIRFGDGTRVSRRGVRFPNNRFLIFAPASWTITRECPDEGVPADGKDAPAQRGIPPLRIHGRGRAGG